MHSSLLIQQSLHYFCSFHVFAYILLDATTLSSYIHHINLFKFIITHRLNLSLRPILHPIPEENAPRPTDTCGASALPVHTATNPPWHQFKRLEHSTHLKNQLTTIAFLKNCKNVLGQVLKTEFSYGKLMLTKGWFSFIISKPNNY